MAMCKPNARVTGPASSPYWIPLIILTCLVVLYCQYPGLKDRLVYHCDVNFYLAPAYGINAPGVFAGDILRRYVAFQIPKGYAGLFFVLGPFANPVVTAQLFPFILSLVSAAYMFLIGREARDDTAGFVMSSLLALHSWTFHTFQGTTPRAFLYPLLLPFVYYLIRKKYLVCVLLCAAQMLFYPPAALISVTVLCISGFVAGKPFISRPAAVSLMLCVLSVVILSFLQFPPAAQREFGPVAGIEDMRVMPEFYPDGKEPVFPRTVMEFLRSPRVGMDLNPSVVFLFIASLSLFALSRITGTITVSIPKEITSLFAAGIILYLAALVSMLRLYLPARYIMYTAPVFLSASIGVLSSVLLDTIGKNKRKAIVFTCILVISLLYLPRMNGRFTQYHHLRGALAFAARTPPEAVIAATPALSDPIPLVAGRKVLFQRGLLIPFQLGYYQIVKNRVLDFYRAYYASSPEAVKDFCSRYSVDYIVFDKRDFSEEYLSGGLLEYEPYRKFIVDLTRGRNDFIVPGMKERIVFEEGDICILKTSDLRQEFLP